MPPHARVEIIDANFFKTYRAPRVDCPPGFGLVRVRFASLELVRARFPEGLTNSRDQASAKSLALLLGGGRRFGL